MKEQEFKDDDWVIRYSERFNQYCIKNINSKIYWYDGDTYKAVTRNMLGTKYLTIKPEAMQKNTVIHCPEEWMAEALCWSADRLGLKWSDGDSYTNENMWLQLKNGTCYNLYSGEYSWKEYYNRKNFKIISFWDAVCGENRVEDTVKEEDSKMYKQKKYAWCVENIKIRDIAESVCEEYGESFMVWCFQNSIHINDTYAAKNRIGTLLLEEIHKTHRKAWLNYALRNNYLKEVEVEPEETFKIGDVIEITEELCGVEAKFIINSCDKNNICLNNKNGDRWKDKFHVSDFSKITYDEIYKNTDNHFKKIGHGAKDLV